MSNFRFSVFFGLCLFAVPFSSASAQLPKAKDVQTPRSAQTDGQQLFDDAVKLVDNGNAESLQAAIPKLTQAARIFNRRQEQAKEAACYNLLGNAFDTLGDQKSAIDFYNKSLKIFELVNDTDSVALILNNLGWVWMRAGDFEQSLANYERGLEVAGKSGNLPRQALIFYNIGYTYGEGGNKNEAVKYYKLALDAAVKVKDESFQFQTISELGSLYLNYGDRREAFEYLSKAAQMPSELSNDEQKYTLYNNLGLASDGLGERQKAINYYEQSLTYLKNLNAPSFEATTVNNIGLVYLSLGNSQKALDNFEQAYKIVEKTAEYNLQATILNNIAYLYDRSGELDKAADYYNQAAVPVVKTKNLSLAAKILNNLSNIFIKLKETDEAFKTLNAGFPIAQTLQDYELQATMLNNYALSYLLLDNRTEAAKYYLQSLNISHTRGLRSLEATTLNNLMYNADSQNNRNLAVFYGKQSVNIYQSLRTDIKNFDKESQKSYLQTVSGAYRKLASILVDLGRLPEAQAILEMLKEEEYLEFVQRDEGEAKKLLGSVELSPQEAEAVARYDKISAEITTKAAEYEKLKRQRPANDEEKAALDKKKAELNADLTAASQTFNLVLKQIETEFAKTKPAADITATMNENRGLQADLARWKIPNTVILSTIVDEENYSVILTTPSVQVVGQTPIKAAELNKLVHDFRSAVQNPCACVDPRPLGEKLYDVLLKPIAPQLAELEKQAGAKPLTLVWSLDGTLRYLPISALWNGKQYLAEKYLNVEFSLASRTRLGENPSADWHGLGVGVTQAHGDFAALPSVKDELLNGAIHDDKTPGSKGIIPGRVFLDTQFTETTFAQELSSGEYPLVHIASHFAFKPGNEKQSYLLLGDGGELSLDKIRQSPDFKFNGVELLTLSACNTATGEAGADGKEFESFAVLAQQNGAMAVLATLWSVADESTQNLMSEFYRGRQENHLSKAEALRNAQLALLNGTLKASQTQTRRSDLAGENADNPANLPPFTKDANKPFAHPFYWSPFVLIGNWR